MLGLTAAGGAGILSSGLIGKRQDRTVHQILRADKVNVGTLPVLRVFAGDRNDYVSPYVLFDEFGPVSVAAGTDPLRVDAHPHAGVMPTTYFLEGTGHHRDSLDYDFQIGKGDFMVFSSGRGAIHMEESGHQLYEEGGNYHGFQIWLNTPAAHKFDAPYTSVFRESDMDILDTADYWVKVVLGELGEAKSSIRTQSPAFYYHVKIKPDSKIELPVEPTHNAFAYLIGGDVEVAGQRAVKPHQVVLYERDGDQLSMHSKTGAELLILGGQPLDEVVFSYGPFVMNTEEQIRQCMANYQSGRMGNPAVVNAG